MFCTNCGKEISDQAKFCPFCGQNMGAAEPPLQQSGNETKIVSPGQVPPVGPSGIPGQRPVTGIGGNGVPVQVPPAGPNGIPGQRQGAGIGGNGVPVQVPPAGPNGIPGQRQGAGIGGNGVPVQVPPAGPNGIPGQRPVTGIGGNGVPGQVPPAGPNGTPGRTAVPGTGGGTGTGGAQQGRGVAPINPNSNGNKNEKKKKDAKGSRGSGGNGALIAIIIVAVVAILAALVVLAYMMFFKKDAGDSGRETTREETVIDDETDDGEDSDADDESGEDESEESGSGEADGGDEDDGGSEEETTAPVEVSTLEPLTRPVDLTSYSHAGTSEASQSSFMEEGYDAWKALDSNDSTSWQDGIDGPGVGETLDFTMDREYEIRYMTFKLGNWFPGDYYTTNDRPETLTITLGDQAWQVTFPDDQQEHVIEIPLGVKTDKVKVQIDSVYEGSQWDDTCITDIGIYAVNDGLGWQREGDSWIYYKAPGERAIDWMEWNKQWYYFLQDGTTAVGWLQLLDEWYYFQPDGHMQVGWLEDGGKWYYFKDDGHMKKGFMPVTTNEYVYAPTGEVSHYGEGYYFLQDGTMFVGELLVWADGYNTPQRMQRYATSRRYSYEELSAEDQAQLPYPTTGMSEVFYSFTADGQYNCRWVVK